MNLLYKCRYYSRIILIFFFKLLFSAKRACCDHFYNNLFKVLGAYLSAYYYYYFNCITEASKIFPDTPVEDLEVDHDSSPETSTSKNTDHCKTEEITEKKQSTENVSNAYIECHLCDTHVPALYINKHENSRKHKNWMRLTLIILERYHLHLTRQGKSYDPSLSSYYCEFCDYIVLIQDKTYHEQTDRHMINVKNDKLIDSLLKNNDKLHSGNEINKYNIEFEKSNDETKSNKSEDQKHVILDLKVVENKEFNTQTNACEESDISIKCNTDKSDKENVILEQKNVLQKLAWVAYVRLLNEKFKLNLIAHDDEIEINIQGMGVTLSEEDFHGLITDNESHTRCAVCNLSIRDIERHTTCKEHTDRLGISLQTIAYESFIYLNADHNLYCFVCDETIELAALTAHLSANHYDPSSNLDETSDHGVEDQKIDYCDVCEKSITDENLHLKEIYHILKLKGLISKHSIYHSFKSTYDESVIKCVVCNQFVNHNNVDIHLISDIHASNYKKITAITSNSETLLGIF